MHALAHYYKRPTWELTCGSERELRAMAAWAELQQLRQEREDKRAENNAEAAGRQARGEHTG